MRVDDVPSDRDAVATYAMKGIGVVALATAIAPLTSYSAGAAAVAEITMSQTTVSGHTIFNYTVKNTGTGHAHGDDITRIEIPEYYLGDLDFFGYGVTLSNLWTATESTAATLTGASLPGGVTPGGYWLLDAIDYGVGPSDSIIFSAESVTDATVKADFAWSVTFAGTSGIVDPPVPDTLIPEPATTAVLGAGLLGLLGLRRRSGPQTPR